jgi:Skp family chaperone for outer membrane proteins
MIGSLPYGLAAPAAAIALSAADAAFPIDQIGQAVLAAIITTGAIVSYLQARKAKTKVEEIHVMVNSQKTELENRIKALEQKLGLASGEEIPHPPIVTTQTDPA